MGSPAWEGGRSGGIPKVGATHSGVCLCQPGSAQPPEEEGHAPSPSLRAVMPYLVSGVRGRGLGHQQPHCGVPALSRLVVPRSHGEGHLLGGDAQLPGGEDRPIGPDLEVHAVGLIVRPLGPQAAAEEKGDKVRVGGESLAGRLLLRAYVQLWTWVSNVVEKAVI